jgi:hypothetical protein
MLIYFPYMHEELLPFAPLDHVVFLDPGLEDASPSDAYYRPESLPVSPKQGAALLNDCLRFGEQFKDPSEMAFFGAQTPEEYFKESTLTIKNELRARLNGEVESSQQHDNVPNAQFTLMLAWSLEKGLVESRELEQGVRDSWDMLGQNLGVENADEREAVLGRTVGETSAPAVTPSLPWQRVMESMPPFLPEDAVLVVEEHAPCVGLWEDVGVVFEEAPKDLGLPEASRVCRAAPWLLAGRKHCPESMPWAEREIVVAVVAASA